MKVYLSNPVSHVVEALLAGAVIRQNDSHSSLIISLCDGSEPLLASGIPNLELYVLAINVYSFYLKINAYTPINHHSFTNG